MSTLSALLNHQTTAGQALRGSAATPMASSTSGTGGTSSTGSSTDSSTSSATISANDFLTLLVTEMQNQDPTADQDPNEYINQLVQVNSLEQLIDINQTLSSDLGSTPSTTDNSASPGVTPAASTAGTSASAATARSLHPTAAASAPSATQDATASLAGSNSTISGNLSAPNASPAAQRVGHALAGRTHAAAVGGISLASQ